MKKLKKIEKALLEFIPNNKAIHLENDVFLTGLLDGSDKIYGFINEDGEILVDGGGFSPYPIRDMDKPDVDYIYGLSAPNIFNKIKNKEYQIIEINEL